MIPEIVRPSVAGKREHATYLSTQWIILHQLLKLLFDAQVPPEQRTTGNGRHNECGDCCDCVVARGVCMDTCRRTVYGKDDEGRLSGGRLLSACL